MKILVINAGSSTLKISLFDLKNSKPTQPLWKQEFDKQTNLKALIPKIKATQNISCIGHRVVHGGSFFDQPTLITPKVKKEIKDLISLAPLHNPENLQAIELMEKLFPKVLQVTVFDTSFHRTMPAFIKTYPIPFEKNIQRYGFHGISHQYCAERAAVLLKKKLSDLTLLNCHLGSGCSLCVIKNGISVDTTMGMTPLEGLMMGTRCGSIDPGILLYLLKEKKFSEKELNQQLFFESGLKAISGFSDMREILKSKEKKAKLAFEMFIYHLKAFMGGMIAAWGPMDAISFTAGIGEHAWQIREKACENLTHIGIQINSSLNKKCQPDQNIASKQSKTQILVIHTEEEWMIAKACLNLLQKKF